ncbi:MAG: lipoyl(octanoyl) transferase LipB [Cyclobacteriaceae bacterium]
MKNKNLIVHNTGFIPYEEGLDLQKNIFQRTVDQKIIHRKMAEEERLPTENHFLFCEHPPTYTLGRSGDAGHLLINNKALEEKGATFHKIGRGGDITFHGPGQVVGYPIIDLDHFFTDIHKYLRFLEEMVILTLADFGVEAGRIDGLTGVWVDHIEQKRPRKICAMGIKCSRWVTMHGFALNINTDLSYFSYIVPCGITGKEVTSLEKELGKPVPLQNVHDRLLHHFSQLFEIDKIEYA